MDTAIATEVIKMFIKVHGWGELVSIPSLEGEYDPSWRRGTVYYRSPNGESYVTLYGLLKAARDMSPYMREAFESLPSRGGDGLALAREVMATSKIVTETLFPDAGKAKKAFLREQSERAHSLRGMDADRIFLHLLQVRRCLEMGESSLSWAFLDFLPRELVREIGNQLEVEAQETLHQLRYRWGEEIPIDELYSRLGVEVISPKEVGEDLMIPPGEEDILLLSVESRNALASDRGWCQYYHWSEQPLWWRGHLVHVSGQPREQGDGWSHDRPFISGEGEVQYVVEARKPYNKELTEKEWELLLNEMEAKYCNLQYFNPLKRGKGWVDTAGNADKLTILLSSQRKEEEFELQCEEFENSLEKKKSSRRSTQCYNKERRRANR